MAELIAPITKVDKRLFDNIYIDKKFIYVGEYKELINEAGIYNQICAYLHKKKKLPQFYAYLCRLYDIEPTDEIPQSVSDQWQNKLIINTRSNIYTEVLRVKEEGDEGFIFYAITNKGKELRYLCHMDGNAQYMRQIRQFLKYNEICTTICDQQGIEHCIDKSDREIKEDIDRCLKYRLLPIIDNVSVLSNNKNEYCLAYYDLTLGNKKNPTPAWDSFMSTFPDDGSANCFKAFIYSIFKGDNFGKQMLWIHGVGDSGKSKIVQAIKKRLELINPGLVISLAPQFFQDKFTTSSHINKRLVIAQDSADRSLVRSQLVKNITGNDDATIRGMAQEASVANIYSKLVVSSNYQPWVNPNKSEELSRMLYINLDAEAVQLARVAWTRDKGNWAHLLLQEIDDFVAKCKNDYDNLLTEDGHNITIYPGMKEKLAGASYLGDNLKIWWDECIEPYEPTPEKRDNVIYFEDLIEDYKRFLGKRGYNPKNAKVIPVILIPFLLAQGVTIHTLINVNNAKYIMGYQWKQKDRAKRETLETMLIKQANKMGEDGIPMGDVFAVRKIKELRGWEIGKAKIKEN